MEKILDMTIDKSHPLILSNLVVDPADSAQAINPATKFIAESKIGPQHRISSTISSSSERQQNNLKCTSIPMEKINKTKDFESKQKDNGLQVAQDVKNSVKHDESGENSASVDTENNKQSVAANQRCATTNHNQYPRSSPQSLVSPETTSDEQENHNCRTCTINSNSSNQQLDASVSQDQIGAMALFELHRSPSADEKTRTSECESRIENNNAKAAKSELPKSSGSQNDDNNNQVDTKQARRTSPAIPSNCTKTMGSGLFPRPCQTHTPTLEEIQSYSFSGYVSEVVLRKALPKFEETTDEIDFVEEDWSKQIMPLTEGISKVTMPHGFWNEEGIGKDRTGRGPAWQKGQPLGDLVLEMPISQHVRGMAGVYEYTFTEVPAISLADFRQKADDYRKVQVGTAVDESDDADKVKEENRLIELDRRFWRRLGPTMPPAWYGADQEGTLFGDDPASGWSLGELDSCLHVLSRVPGVTTPYLYAGMWASVFCAHTEDMNLLSINYLHAGAPKIWYAIAPGPDAKRFEALCEFQYSVAARGCKEFMRHKRHLISPMVLQKAGIKYTTTVQRPGDAIITFPGGYHFGFNTGFNMAEATNFGVPEWIPFGLQARVCLCRPDSVRIDMNKLISLLELYEADRLRRRVRSWKEWARKRDEKKQREKEREKKKKNQKSNHNILATTAAKKRKLLSEQEKKNEFWIEVVKPTAVKPPAPVRKPKKQVEEEGGRGKRRKKKTLRAALWEEECKKEIEKPAVKEKKVEKEVWHLAKPIGRKGVDINARVLCLLPGTTMSSKMNDDLNVSTREAFPEDEEEDQCFRGVIVERNDNFVRVHLDGLSKYEDVWVELGKNKVYLDGGPWLEGDEECTIPQLHYWKEMDSKSFLGEDD